MQVIIPATIVVPAVKFIINAFFSGNACISKNSFQFAQIESFAFRQFIYLLRENGGFCIAVPVYRNNYGLGFFIVWGSIAILIFCPNCMNGDVLICKSYSTNCRYFLCCRTLYRILCFCFAPANKYYLFCSSRFFCGQCYCISSTMPLRCCRCSNSSVCIIGQSIFSLNRYDWLTNRTFFKYDMIIQLCTVKRQFHIVICQNITRRCITVFQFYLERNCLFFFSNIADIPSERFSICTHCKIV